MRIEIDNNSGFCFGVMRATSTAESELEKNQPLYCLGDIVHNGQEVDRLTRLGLITIDHTQLAQLHDVRVLLRAHGEPPHTYELAQHNNITIIDATCPVVLKLQQKIHQAYTNHPDAQIVIYGKIGHAEVIGLEGQTEGKAIVIEDENDLSKIDFSRPIILFVAGAKSSNGKVLFNECLNVNPRTYLVSSPDELQSEWFNGIQSVGICGATSTPKWLMEAVKQKINSIL